MSNAFLGIDTARHLKAVRQACPEGWEVALCAGETLLDSTDQSTAEHVVADLILQKVDLNLSDAHEAVVDALWVHLLPVVNHLRECLGVVLVYGRHGAGLEASFPRVHLLIEGLQSEVTLSMELADMAEELNRRHEELNLIYNTNEQPDDEADDEEILRGIVENVVDYLEADLVLLTVPSRNVWMLAGGHGVSTENYQGYLEKAEPSVLDWLKRHRQALVINEPEEAASYEVAENLPFRVLVAPVTDDREEIIGGLALCRATDGARIVNSDKNLLTALTRRIGKVIQVSFDPLTGLPRRQKFERMMERAITGLMTQREQHSLLHINIDGLSTINEQYGVRSGDAAIELVAAHLGQVGRAADVCGRVGGDELTLLLLNCNQKVAMQKADQLHEALAKQPFLVGRTSQTLRASIGVVSVRRGVSATEAMTKASVACGIAKERGGNVSQLYESAYEQVTQKREEVRLATVVRRALERDDMFQLYAQPIVPLQEEDAAPHFEVLLRLFSEDGEMISPADFIPVAEKHSLMPEIDRYVTRNAIAQLGASGILRMLPGTVCSVNLSGQSLGPESVLEDLQTLLSQYNVPARNLCFEVTETAAISDLGGAQYHINNTRKLGCRFALDDFGAGLSSFTYLRVLPLDYVKVDGSFVKDMLTDDIARTMVQSIHNVGHAMGLETVAEYVENEAIAEDLKTLGIDFGQGFGLGKPVPMAGYLEGYVHGEQQASG